MLCELRTKWIYSEILFDGICFPKTKNKEKCREHRERKILVFSFLKLI